MPPTVSPSKPRRLLDKADLTVDEVESIISELTDKVARLQAEVRELKRTSSSDSHREADVTKISQYASDRSDGWKKSTAGPGRREEESRGSEASSHGPGDSHRALSRRGRGEAPATQRKREPLHRRGEAAKNRARTASEEARDAGPATISAPPTPETRKVYIRKRISRGVQYEKPTCPESCSMRRDHSNVPDTVKRSPLVSTYKDKKQYTSSAPIQSNDRAAEGWESGGRRKADSPSRSPARAQRDSGAPRNMDEPARIDDRQRYDYAGAADARRGGGPHRRSEIDGANEARRPRWPLATGVDEKIEKTGDDDKEQKKDSEAKKKISFKTKRKSDQASVDESRDIDKKKTSSKTVRIEEATKRIEDKKNKSLVVLNDERKDSGKSDAKEIKKGEEKPKKNVSKEKKKLDSPKEKKKLDSPKEKKNLDSPKEKKKLDSPKEKKKLDSQKEKKKLMDSSKEKKKLDPSKEKASQEDLKKTISQEDLKETSHKTRKNKIKRLMRIDKKKVNGSNNNETEEKKDVEEKISNSSDSKYKLVKRKLNDCSGELHKVMATISDLFRDHKQNNKAKK